MPRLSSIIGIQGSRWGFHPKEAGATTNDKDDSSSETDKFDHNETEINDGLEQVPEEQKTQDGQHNGDLDPADHHKTNTSATITEQEWSVIEEASKAYEQAQDDETLKLPVSLQREDEPEDGESKTGESLENSNGQGDQLGAEALLDLGKQKGHQSDESQRTKLDIDSSKVEIDDSRELSNSENATDVSSKNHQAAEFTEEQSHNLFAEPDDHTQSENLDKHELALSEDNKLSGASYSSTAALVAAAAAAIGTSSSAQDSSQQATAASGGSGPVLDSELQALLNQDHPNWQRFYSENINSTDEGPSVELSMLINENDGSPVHSSISISTNSRPSTTSAVSRTPGKRGRKRKNKVVEVESNNSIQEGEVDPSLQQIDMNASASEAIAARISKEQSQLEDALLHASAIAHDIQSQSSSSSMIYNDVIIHDEERPLKRRNIEVPPSVNDEIHDSGDNRTNGDDDNGINSLILNEALRMANVKYQVQTAENEEDISEPVDTEMSGEPSNYWDQSPAQATRQRATNRVQKSAATTQRKSNKRNSTGTDSISSNSNVGSSGRRRYSKRESIVQQQSEIPHDVMSDVPTVKELDPDDPSMIDPNWQSSQELPEHGGSFTQEEILKIDTFMSNYCLENHINREALCNRVWSNERVKDNFWDRVADVLPHRARASVYKHIRRAYHVFKSRGKWQDQEDEELKMLYNEKGSQWKIIGQLMGRMPEDCRDRWRNYVKCGNNRMRNKWDAEEEGRLREAVAQVIAEHPENEINWTLVSDKMGGTRSRIQCRYKWNKMMKRATIAKIDAMMTQDKLSLIKYLLDNGYEDESQVDWDGFAAMDSRGFWSGAELQMAFERLKPKDTYLNKSFREIVLDLHEELSMDAGNLKDERLRDSISEIELQTADSVPIAASAVNVGSVNNSGAVHLPIPSVPTTLANGSVTAPASLTPHVPISAGVSVGSLPRDKSVSILSEDQSTSNQVPESAEVSEDHTRRIDDTQHGDLSYSIGRSSLSENKQALGVIYSDGSKQQIDETTVDHEGGDHGSVESSRDLSQKDAEDLMAVAAAAMQHSV